MKGRKQSNLIIKHSFVYVRPLKGAVYSQRMPTVDSFDINCVGVSFVLQDQLFQEEKGLLVISLKWKNKF